ncbi:ABC transporter permease [Mycolicibacterium baixiangningiae]|uniref:ABC transporter permease n=1 Tax=Mycolicibacterium baixiangningiae TaxID=2761578 RepID=UPI00186695E9|nr:ABC transporter permease [Mycolicibacterium baixiangningiae]
MTYLLRKIIQTLIVLVGVVTLVFFMLRLIPGDPVRVIAPTANETAAAQIRAELGLDRPLLSQYWGFLQQMVRGDFGDSYFFQGGAFDLVVKALPYTALLALTALVLSLLAGISLGVFSARREDKWSDRTINVVTIILQSMPNFWVAIMLGSFVAVKSGIFPTVGYVGPISVVLPSVALAVPLTAVIANVVRTNMADTLRSEMAVALRARGLSPTRIAWRHALRLTGVPLLTVMGAQFGYLLGGAVVVEYIFNYPGMGLLTLNTVLRRDYPLMQVITLVTALIFLVLNLLIDLSYGRIDRRMAIDNRAGTRAKRSMPGWFPRFALKGAQA